MTLNLDTLRKIAEAAPAGDWGPRTTGPRHGDHWYVASGGEHVAMIAAQDGINEEEREPLATHIATFDPPTVLALLSRLEQAEQAVEKSKRACEALGRVIEIDGANLVKLTDSQELVDADGDGDWEEIWGIAFDLKDRATKAEQAVSRVREVVTHLEDHSRPRTAHKFAVAENLRRALDGDGRG